MVLFVTPGPEVYVYGNADPLFSYEFDNEDTFSNWKEKTMKGKVAYSIEQHNGISFLHALSEKTASGLFHPIEFNIEEYPVLSWEWDVLRFPKKDDQITKENDDYAARVYVIFKGPIAFRVKCIEYIWEERRPEETIFVSPYSKSIRFIVAQSGPGGRGWVQEERNLYEDYKKAFGEEPKRSVRAVAVMTDSDNTESSAEALYRRIEIREHP